MTTTRSWLPTLDEIEALERQVAEANPPPEPDAVAKLEAYKKSVRKHGRYLRVVPILGALGTLLVESSAPWWSTALAAGLFVGAGWLWGERLALLRYRQLLERELLPARGPLHLAAVGEGAAVGVPVLGDVAGKPGDGLAPGSVDEEAAESEKDP